MDDGSQDGIKDKINVLKSRYRNIVFVQNNKNMGMGFSIKKGINLSKFKKFMIIPGQWYWLRVNLFLSKVL